MDRTATFFLSAYSACLDVDLGMGRSVDDRSRGSRRRNRDIASSASDFPHPAIDPKIVRFVNRQSLA
ncbi:hypothetical protein DSM3645_12831 [Blastopirellula marina DSM 3645]|uniref:Uncharacterized protein n=1 Tax=Blastopirellula marina DSM 3645 TaxID=314230 RepID=A3ZRY3_9BACT|nr:hypothetical protein DSM3645_12831 [Blastopirellula marina DSM 3645]